MRYGTPLSETPASIVLAVDAMPAGETVIVVTRNYSHFLVEFAVINAGHDPEYRRPGRKVDNRPQPGSVLERRHQKTGLASLSIFRVAANPNPPPPLPCIGA